ncbi:MAG: copper amine oxidase N-terminal domain-containing protein [Dethiobacteria bacterium]
MSIRSRKLFALLVVSMMILTMMPLTAFAASTNSVDKVVQVSSDHNFTAATAPTLRIEEKNLGEFSSVAPGEAFRLTLENAEWDAAAKAAGVLQGVCTLAPVGTAAVTVNILSDTVAEVNLIADSTPGRTAKQVLQIPLWTEITGDGEAKVTIDSRDSAVSSGTFVFANSAAGKTITSISKVNSFSRRGNLEAIQIDETRIGALGIAAQSVKIKLPPKFTWDLTSTPWPAAGDIVFSGGLAGTTILSAVTATAGDGTRTLEINFTPGTNTAGLVDRSSRGSIFLNNLVIVADRDAALGDVVVDVDGANITAHEMVVAKNMEYSIKASIPEAKEVVAGSYDNKTAKITIEEGLPGAMIANREISVVLPEWVKVVRVRNTNATGGLAVGDLVQPANRQNEIYFVVNAGINTAVKSKYQFELELSIEADKEGDIVAEIFGAGMEKQELTVAKAVSPVTVEIKPADVKIGVQNQPAPDIIITETAKGRIDNDLAVYDGINPVAGAPAATGNARQLTITPPAGFEFSDLPKVEVTEGNLELGPSRLVGGVLTLQIDSSSTRPSTIKISDIKLTLDRTVPEGDFNVNIGGGAIVKNNHADATISTVVKFNKNRVVKALFGTVITPAPGETRATTTFTIGSTDYTVVEAAEAVEYTMDVAPYIKDGRTFLPLRYVANALGVDDDNIIWDQATKAVTIFKGDRIAQVTISSKTMLVNGVTINMDVTPEITDGRTMLPIRWMAQALGASIDWDAETRTVTVAQ